MTDEESDGEEDEDGLSKGREAPRTPYPVRGVQGLKAHLAAASHGVSEDRKPGGLGPAALTETL